MFKKVWLHAFNIAAGIAVGSSAIGVAGFVIHDILNTKIVVQDILYKDNEKFSYMNENNTRVGFNNVEFKTYINKGEDIFNEIDPFIGDDGKSYLIERFIETGIFGPEISSLKSITIGDRNKITNEAVGVYYPSTREIFINIPSSSRNNVRRSFSSFKANKGADLSQKELSLIYEKMKAEVVFETLMHEYLHHVVSSYTKSNLPIFGIDEYKTKGNEVSFWNDYFIQKFKEYLNYDHPTGTKVDLLAGVREINSISAVANVKDLYEMANDGKEVPHEINDIGVADDSTNYAFVPKNYETDANTYNNGGIYLTIKNKDSLLYLYSLDELSVRKLLLSGMIENNIYNHFMDAYTRYIRGDIDKNPTYIPTIYGAALARTDFITNDPNNNVHKTDDKEYKLKTKRYLFDNVFASANSQRPSDARDNEVYPNETVSKKLVELIDTLMGNGDGADLSFISSENNTFISSADSENTWMGGDISVNNMNNISLGGYIDGSNYLSNSYIGYLDNDNKFVKLSPINVYKHQNKYKNTPFQSYGETVGKDEYFYYSNRFNINKYKNGRPLAIANMDSNGQEVIKSSIYKLKNFRGEIDKQKTGYASNYSSSIVNNLKSVSKSDEIWYYPEKDRDGGVIISREKYG